MRDRPHRRASRWSKGHCVGSMSSRVPAGSRGLVCVSGGGSPGTEATTKAARGFPSLNMRAGRLETLGEYERLWPPVRDSE